MKIAVFISLIALTLALPFNEEEERRRAVNTYLYGEPDPAWLHYINANGEFDPSLVPEGVEVQPPEKDPFYDAAASVKFFLHTRTNDGREQLVLEDTASIQRSTFDSNKLVKVLVHGWRNDETSDFVQIVKNAYLTAGDYNVLVVDWSKGGDTINYWGAKAKVPDVAAVLARFIRHLVNNQFTTVPQIHMTGHSLGAHIIGLASRNFQSPQVPALFGLDPALPWVDVSNINDRIDASDAEYVEIIHTSSGNLGIDVPVGDADFYPNYGNNQPGCFWEITGSCDHGRAYEFFAESIVNPNAFISKECPDYNPSIKKSKCASTALPNYSFLGGNTKDKVGGIFYCSTEKKSPYGKGHWY